MKIAFVNYTPLVYTVETPYESPLGGSESAMCYLAEALASRGHEVSLFVHSDMSGVIRGVRHIPIKKISGKDFKGIDVVVIQNTPEAGKQIKMLSGKKTKIVLWMEHAADQPAVECLDDISVIDLFDSIVFVSFWQMREFLRNFDIDSKECFILRNAVSPVFEKMFGEGERIFEKKMSPPVLAYASTPFRGLDRLLGIFPVVREAIPDVRLEVFSSLAVYQTDEETDKKNYGELYDLCQKTDGVELVGSLSQTQLAYRLKPVSIYVYPNTFPETACTSVMEAMAAGCRVITSNLGALPETTAGFGVTVDFALEREEFERKFALEIITMLREYQSGEYQKIDDLLSRQVYFTNNAYTWQKRAEEWEFFVQNRVLNLNNGHNYN